MGQNSASPAAPEQGHPAASHIMARPVCVEQKQALTLHLGSASIFLEGRLVLGWPSKLQGSQGTVIQDQATQEKSRSSTALVRLPEFKPLQGTSCMILGGDLCLSASWLSHL